MKRGSFFPANGTRYTGTFFGVPAIARRMIASLVAMSTVGLTSRGSGIRLEDKSDPYAWAFRGDCGPLQSFRGAAGFVGASAAGIRPGFNTVLPGTTALPAEVHNQLPGNPA